MPLFVYLRRIEIAQAGPGSPLPQFVAHPLTLALCGMIFFSIMSPLATRLFYGSAVKLRFYDLTSDGLALPLSIPKWVEITPEGAWSILNLKNLSFHKNISLIFLVSLHKWFRNI